MMDQFKEDIVTCRSTLLPNVLYALCWVLIVVSGLYAFMLLQVLFMVSFDVVTAVTLLLSIACAVLLFLVKDNLKTEYEYTFTNGTLDFAKVLRGARRKELGSMNVANVAASGHVAHESFKRYLSMKDVQRKNWFLNRDGNLFYFYYTKEGRKHMIIIEPSEELVQMMIPYFQAGVYQG